MPLDILDKRILYSLLGERLYGVFQALDGAICEKYINEAAFGYGGKGWSCEYKYRCEGKRLCAVYADKLRLGLLIAFSAKECQKIEELRPSLSEATVKELEAAADYRGGKLVMFQPSGKQAFGDYMRLLAVKRKPDR